MSNKKTILVIDDTPMYLDLLAEALQPQYHVVTEQNSHKALGQVLDTKPDLILLDIVMPGLSGFEICRKIKSTSGCEDIPIIFLTSLNENEDELKGLELGAVDYITKPIKFPVLLARIKTHLKLRALQIKLEMQAQTDYLTGCYNRRYFYRQASQELARHQRYARPLSLLMLDIDFFKKINDTYGHDKGDEVLKTLANKVNSVLRKNDLFARLGGEEFVLLLPETSKEQAFVVAEKIRQLLSQTRDDKEIRITVSIGLAADNHCQYEHIDELVKQADMALYQAKEGGRNRVVVSK